MDLDDPVDRWLPHGVPDGGRITVRHLPGTYPRIRGAHPRGCVPVERDGGGTELVDFTEMNPSLFGAAGEMISTAGDLDRSSPRCSAGGCCRTACWTRCAHRRPAAGRTGWGWPGKDPACGITVYGNDGDALTYRAGRSPRPTCAVASPSRSPPTTAPISTTPWTHSLTRRSAADMKRPGRPASGRPAQVSGDSSARRPLRSSTSTSWNTAHCTMNPWTSAISARTTWSVGTSARS